MAKNKKVMFIILSSLIVIVVLICIGIFINRKLNDNRKNSIATYQLSTASAWSIKYNKNPNFLIELADGNILKVEAIGSEATVKITCSNEKDEEIVLKATYTKTDGVKIVSENGENDDMKIKLKIGEKNFDVVLYENSATNKLKEKLPLTLTMNELNGNEKYCYLDYSLPTTSIKPEKINAGEIMLYTSNCLVLFYDSFDTEYSYTKIGYIEDIEGLKEALDSGTIEIEITLE